MSNMDYLPFVKNFLRGTGLVPSSTPLTKIFALSVSLPVIIILNGMILYRFRQTSGNILRIAESFDALSTLTQLTARKIIFILKGPLFEDILNDCKKNWRYDLFGPDIKKKLCGRMEFCRNFIKFFGWSCFCTILAMCASAMFDEDKALPLISWIPEIKGIKNILFICDSFVLLETLYYVLATDSFYFFTGMDLQIQYKLIGLKLKSIQFGKDKIDKCLQKMTESVKHHRRLLRIHKKLNQVFSEYFLVQYTITVATISIQLYLLLYRELELATMLRSIMYCFSVMFQAGIYYIPASNIEIAAEKFSSEIYFTNWESNCSLEISKHYQFILLNSQKPLKMWGAGMLDINRPEYFGMFRLSFTIATILGRLNN